MFGSNIKCPNCDHANKRDAEFCSGCGADLVDQRDPEIKGNAWQARRDEFAASITIQDLEGFFTKSPLMIRPGQRALVFQENQCHGVVGPGEYQLESFLSVLNRLGKHKDIWAIICREDELAVDFGLGKIPTREFLEVEVELSIAMRVSDPDLFAKTVAGKPAYTITDLRTCLQPQLRQILVEHIRGRGIRELQADTHLRTDIDMLVSKALEPFLKDMGIGLGTIQTITVGHARLDENNQIRGNTWLSVDKERAKLEGRKQLDELYSEEEWRKIARLEMEQQIQAKVRSLEFNNDESEFTDRLKRIGLLEKSLKADSREQALQIGAKDEIKQLEHEAKKSGLARADEELSWEYTRKLAGIKLDAELSIAKIEQERIVSEERIRLDRSREIADLEHEFKVAQKVEGEDARRKAIDTEKRLAEAKVRRDEELSQKRHEFELHAQDLIKNERTHELERINLLKDEKLKSEIAIGRLELEELKRDADSTHQDTEDDRAYKNKKRAAELEYEIRKREAELESRLQNEKAAREAEAREAEAKNKQDAIKQLAAIDKAIDDGKNELAAKEIEARIERERIQAAQNMSAEQHLAEGAKNSPNAAADVLKEHYRNKNENANGDREQLERERALLEKEREHERAVNEGRLNDQRDFMDRMERMNNASNDRDERMHNKSMDTNVDLQRHSQQSQQPQTPPQNVFVTPAGPVTAQPVNTGTPANVSDNSNLEKVIICPNPDCARECEPTARFCGHCGNKLG